MQLSDLAVILKLPCPACRELAAAAHTLSQFAAAATSSMAQPGGGPPWLLDQVVSACRAFKSCVVLARSASQLSNQTAFRLGVASCLVFGPGRTVLSACVAAACTSQATSPAFLRAANLAGAQLDTIFLLVSNLLQPSRAPRAAAAFASSTAKPSALLP